MKNLISILALTLVAGAAPARAGGALESMLSYSAATKTTPRAPEASAPVDAKFLLLSVNRDGYYYTSEYDCRADGEAAALKIANAGFRVLSQKAEAWRDNSGNLYWRYWVDYSLQPGMITPQFITYMQSLNNYGGWYKERWEAAQAARETARVLETAGYIVLNSWPRYAYGSSDHWEFEVTYTAKAGRLTASASVHEVLVDKNGKRFTTVSEADWAAQEFSGKLGVAGYFPLHRRLAATDLDGNRYYSCYVYFLPRAGRAPAELQYFDTDTDENNAAFDWDIPAQLAGEGVKSKLEAAGYVVLESRLLWQPAYKRWTYQNVYVAPSGYSSSKVQTLLLEKGADGQPYTGYWGQQTAKSDGAAMAETLKSAGYTVLKGVTKPRWLQSDTWAHEISYIQPVK